MLSAFYNDIKRFVLLIWEKFFFTIFLTYSKMEKVYKINTKGEYKMDNNLNMQQYNNPMPTVEQPKKKTGLIIGIVAAVVALVAVIAIVLVLVLGGSDDIVGKWEAEVEGVTMAFEFKDDNTGSMSVSGFSIATTWELDGDTLTLTMSVLNETTTQEFDVVEISSDTLILSVDGEDQEFKRVK